MFSVGEIYFTFFNVIETLSIPFYIEWFMKKGFELPFYQSIRKLKNPTIIIQTYSEILLAKDQKLNPEN